MASASPPQMLMQRLYIIVFLLFLLSIWIPVGMVVAMGQCAVEKVATKLRRRGTRGKGRVIKYKDNETLTSTKENKNGN